MGYRAWIQLWTPPLLRRRWGSRFAFVPATLADAVLEAVRQAARASSIGSGPDDAVGLHAASRRIEPGLDATTATLRQRCQAAWISWAEAGTGPGLLARLGEWLPGATWDVYADRDWPTLDAESGVWWSRFFVVCRSHPWTSWAVGGGRVVGDRTVTVGSTAPPWVVESARRLIRRHKAAHEQCPWVGLPIDGASISSAGLVSGPGYVAFWPITERST